MHLMHITAQTFIVQSHSPSCQHYGGYNGTSVEVCIAISGSIARNDIITAETAPKAEAANQATG